MIAPESPDAALESLVGQIADEFTRRHHRGEAPRLEEYTERYPELAGLLREILPAIQALSPAPAETPRTQRHARPRGARRRRRMWPITRFSPRSAAAAWASSTRRGTGRSGASWP